MRVAAGCDYLKDAVLQAQDRDVKSPAAEIIDGNQALLAAVQPIGKRGRGRLVHQPQDLQAGHAPGVFGRLPLRVVEVGRYRHHCLGHRLAEVALRIALQLPKHLRGDLGRRVLMLADGQANYLARRHIGSQPEWKQP